MAKPQKENGYVAIANELLEAFMKINLSPHEWRFILCVIRFSYGWNKKSANLSCSQISRYIGIDRRVIPRIIRKLVNKNILIKDGNLYTLQKDYDKWVVNNPNGVIYTDDKLSSKQMTKCHLNRRQNVIHTDDKLSSKQMTTTPPKALPDKALRDPKDIFKDIPKDIYKYISLKAYNSNCNASSKPNNANNMEREKEERELILKDLKTYFPNINPHKTISTKSLDYLLWQIEQGNIVPSKIKNPIAYVKAIHVDEDENYINYLERLRLRYERNKKYEEAKTTLRKQFTQEERKENIVRLRELIYNVMK